MSAAPPVWMVRINPLVRERLADPELARLLDRAAALEAETEALAEAACDDLYRLVPASPEPLRGRLLARRRDIHNDRYSGPACDGVEWPASVMRWTQQHRQRQACRAQIREAYPGALGRERSGLRRHLGQPDFLTTLAQSAPGVYDAAHRYRSHEMADAKDRKAERALTQYLTRAMVRTSPYGRFTAVGLGQPHPAGVAMDEVRPDSARPQIDVDRPMFDHVMGGLVPSPSGGDPLLSLPPTARVSDDRVTFFQVRPDALRRLSAPLTAQTRLLLELLDLGPCRRSALASALAARLQLELPEGQRLVDIAVRLGLLVTAWRGDNFVADPVEEAVRDLAGTGAEPLAGLRQFRADLNRLGDAGPGERRAITRQLETVGDTLSRLAGRPAKLTVNEDYVLDPLLVDPGAHQPALDDLTAVTELLSAFDRMHVVRALVAGALVARFGPGCRVPLVEHAEALVRAVYQAERLLAEHPDAAVGPADGSLGTLAKVRRETLTALHQDLAGPDDICWSAADVLALVAGVPDRFRDGPACYALVVQPHGRDLILNDTYAGHGPMLSRFLHADAVRGGDSRDRLRRRIEALYGPDTELVEDRGSHNLSINAHPPILSHAIDPDRWRRLQLAHDPDADTVAIVDADGAPVTPLALGAQLPELFPYPVRLATWLCSSGRVVLDIPGKLHQQRPPSVGTVAYRRLRVGHVVVSRRRWYPGADFPVPGAGQDDVEYLLAVTGWRQRHDVPAEVMLKSIFDGPTAWESLSAPESRQQFFDLRSRSKPQYVDLASALMTRILPRLLERRPPGCVEEARPGLAGGGPAREWMVEVARPAGRRQFDWRPDPEGDR